MSEKINLPSGGWAIVREPSAVPVRLRRPVEKALLVLGKSQAKGALEAAPSDLNDEAKAAQVAATIDPAILDEFNDLNDLLIIARIESWSFENSIDLDSVGNLSQGDYEVLQQISATDITSMMPKFGISNDSDSPTKPSDA